MERSDRYAGSFSGLLLRLLLPRYLACVERLNNISLNLSMSILRVILLLSVLVALDRSKVSALPSSEPPSEERLDDPFVRILYAAAPTVKRSLSPRTKTIKQTATRTRTIKRTATRTLIRSRTRTTLRTPMRKSPTRTKTTLTKTFTPRRVPTATNGACRPDRGVLIVGRNEFDSYTFNSTGPVTCANQTSHQVGTFAFEATADATYVFTTYLPKPPITDRYGDNDALLASPISSVIVIKNVSTCAILSCGGLDGGVLRATLKRGDRVNVVVGGVPLVPGIGTYTLSITEYRTSVCFPAPQPGAPALLLGTNEVVPLWWSAPYDPGFKVCGNQYTLVIPAANYFIAPSNGSYIFDTDAHLPVAITVRAEVGNTCTVLGCNQHPIGAARLVVSLRAGQRATVIVGATVPWLQGRIPVVITKAVKGVFFSSFPFIFRFLSRQQLGV